MASEENDQLVTEIVNEVLSASLHDHHQTTDLESDQTMDETTKGVGADVENPQALVQSELALGESSTDSSNDAQIGEEVANGMKGLNLSLGQDTGEIDGKAKADPEETSPSQQDDDHRGKEEVIIHEANPVYEQHFDENAPTVVHDSLIASEVISPSSLEPKLEVTDDEDKQTSSVEEKSNGNLGIGEGKTFEPTTPPALGMDSQQREQHQLEQHQNQSTLFTVSGTATRGNITEDSDVASTVHQEESSPKAKNGADNTTKYSQQAGADGGSKTEPKAKTKVCALL